MLNQKKLNTKMLEHTIVEQGTSGNWEYRKRNDGFAECWYRDFTKTNVSFSAWGGLYYADVATGLTFPFEFLSPPIVYYSPVDSQAGIFGSWGVSTTGVGTVRVFHNAANAATVRFNIYAVGKWK